MHSTYIPAVVIIGRPNVGKSTLFNIIARSRISIVESTPGVTRDRIIKTVTWGGKRFDLIDTGGIGIVDEQDLAELVEKQIEIAIELADVVMFMVDIQTGLNPIESLIAKKLILQGKKVVVVANKADRPFHEERKYEFLRLGMGEPVVISATGRRGLDILEKRISETIQIPEGPAEAVKDDIPKIAIIGRRNVGKSSLVNALAHEERVIVSSIPGTTRDAVDVAIKRNGKEYVLIDTAGLRKKRQLKNSIEFYGSVRTERSIGRADGVLLIIDAVNGLSIVDKHVAAEIVKRYKPCVIVVNKWDLASAVLTGEYTKYIEAQLSGLHFAPVVYISVQKKQRYQIPVDVAASLIEQAKIEIKTSLLNRIVQDAIKSRRPPLKKNKEPKIFYAVQTGMQPPCFRIFTNDASLFDNNYTRFLTNCIRKNSECCEIPLKIEFVTREHVSKG